MKPTKSGEKLHILFVLENYYPNIGGVETLFKKLAEHLAAEGHRATIITTRLRKNDPPEEYLGNLRILRYRFFNRYFFTLLAVFPVLFYAGKCDLVHTTSYNAALPAWLGARLRRRKVIITFHEVWGKMWFELPFMGRFGKRLHFLFEQLILRLNIDCFVGVSNSTSENLAKSGIPPNRLRTIFNGIDYQDFCAKNHLSESPKLSERLSSQATGNGLSETPFTYTYFGRLGVSKGLDILLEAARVFQAKFPFSRLKLIVPKTPAGFFKLILDEIEKKGLNNHIQLLHHLPFEELKAELIASDCVVIPSMSEGFCFAAVESIALGVPVISSGKGALREVVSNKFITMKTLTPADLVQALEQARIGEWQTSPVKKFEISQTLTAYLNLYRDLTG
ncbi:MAG: glycosyltransferase family 4 protein [Bacteroidota bacterium]